jgi:hypothetical protein
MVRVKDVPFNSPARKCVDIYNGIFGLIGIKNLVVAGGEKTVKTVKNLSAAIKNIPNLEKDIIVGKNISEYLRVRLINFKFAYARAEAEGLQDLTLAQKEDLLRLDNSANEMLGSYAATFFGKIKSYKKLLTAIDGLSDELKVKFIEDFVDVDAVVLKALDEDASLIKTWSGITSTTIPKSNIKFLEWAKKLKDRVNPQGDNLFKHIFEGKTGVKDVGISGVHHKNALTTKTSGFTNGDIRIKAGTKLNKSNGYYEAEIEYFDATSGTWITKTENGVNVKNGFFPDNMTPDEIMEEIAHARANMTMSNWVAPISPKTTSNTYESTLSNGQKVWFYIGSQSTISPTSLRWFNYAAQISP